MINYIDISIIVLFLIFSFVGYKRGILISVLSLARYIVGLPLCYGISDKYSQSVYTAFVEPRAVDYINKKIASANSLDEFTSGIKKAIGSLPNGLKGSLDLSKLDFTTKNLAEGIVKNAFEPALISATRAIIFLIVFILFFGATAILVSIISSAKTKSRVKNGKTVLSRLDCGFGLLLGVFKYAIIVLVVASVLRYAVTLDVSKTGEFFTQVADSKILSFINDINPFDKYVGG